MIAKELTSRRTGWVQQRLRHTVRTACADISRASVYWPRIINP